MAHEYINQCKHLKFDQRKYFKLDRSNNLFEIFGKTPQICRFCIEDFIRTVLLKMEIVIFCG